MTDRAAELAAMAEFMAKRGVLRWPPAHAVPSQHRHDPEREGTIPPLVRGKYDGCRGIAKLRREPA